MSIFNIHSYIFTYIHLHPLKSFCVSSSHVPLSALRPPCGCQVGNRTWDYCIVVRCASNLATPHPNLQSSHAAPQSNLATPHPKQSSHAAPQQSSHTAPQFEICSTGSDISRDRNKVKASGLFMHGSFRPWVVLFIHTNKLNDCLLKQFDIFSKPFRTDSAGS